MLPLPTLMAMHCRKEYVLPDGISSTWGHVLGEGPAEAVAQPTEPAAPGKAAAAKQTLLVVNNERFMVPEALFHPTDIGMPEAGLAEAIAAAIQSAHPQLHGLLYSNIVLSGKGWVVCKQVQLLALGELVRLRISCWPSLHALVQAGLRDAQGSRRGWRLSSGPWCQMTTS